MVLLLSKIPSHGKNNSCRIAEIMSCYYQSHAHIPVRYSFNLAIKNYEGMFPFGKQCLSSRETHSYCFFRTLSVVVFEQVASFRCQPGKVTTSCPLAPRWKFVFSSIVTCTAVILFFQLILKSITLI